MRLAFINANRGWGGVKTWTLEFAAALTAMGHHVSIMGREGAFIERAHSLGLPAHPVNFGPDYNPLAILRFMRYFREHRIEAVLVNIGRDFRTAGIAARLCGLPLVQRIGLPGDQKNVWKVKALHHVLRPHYLCPCAFNRDGMLTIHPYIHPDDTTVIHSAKQPLDSPPETVHSPLQLATTSQLKADKGHGQVLDALAILKKEGYRFHWHIAGKGSSEAALRKQAADLGLADNITWHGWTQDVRSVLSQADVFVLPSLSEGLPNTLLEAMASGLVPVSRDVGGVKEIWPESMPEFLLPYSSGPEAFARVLRTIFDAERDKEHNRVSGWKFDSWNQCRTAFSLSSQAAKVADFFANLIQTHQ